MKIGQNEVSITGNFAKIRDITVSKEDLQKLKELLSQDPRWIIYDGSWSLSVVGNELKSTRPAYKNKGGFVNIISCGNFPTHVPPHHDGSVNNVMIKDSHGNIHFTQRKYLKSKMGEFLGYTVKLFGDDRIKVGCISFTREDLEELDSLLVDKVFTKSEVIRSLEHCLRCADLSEKSFTVQCLRSHLNSLCQQVNNNEANSR